MSQWTCISKLVWLDNNLPCLVICCAYTVSVIRQITATKANFLILERYKWYVSKIMQEKCTKFNVKMTRTMYSLLKCRPYSSLKSIGEMYAMVLSSHNIHSIFLGEGLVFQCYTIGIETQIWGFLDWFTLRSSAGMFPCFWVAISQMTHDPLSFGSRKCRKI